MIQHRSSFCTDGIVTERLQNVFWILVILIPFIKISKTLSMRKSQKLMKYCMYKYIFFAYIPNLFLLYKRFLFVFHHLNFIRSLCWRFGPLANWTRALPALSLEKADRAVTACDNEVCSGGLIRWRIESGNCQHWARKGLTEWWWHSTIRSVPEVWTAGESNPGIVSIEPEKGWPSGSGLRQQGLFRRFDPLANRTRELPALSQKRAGRAVVECDNKIFAIGGAAFRKPISAYMDVFFCAFGKKITDTGIIKFQNFSRNKNFERSRLVRLGGSGVSGLVGSGGFSAKEDTIMIHN